MPHSVSSWGGLENTRGVSTKCSEPISLSAVTQHPKHYKTLIMQTSHFPGLQTKVAFWWILPACVQEEAYLQTRKVSILRKENSKIFLQCKSIQKHLLVAWFPNTQLPTSKHIYREQEMVGFPWISIKQSLTERNIPFLSFRTPGM